MHLMVIRAWEGEAIGEQTSKLIGITKSWAFKKHDALASSHFSLIDILLANDEHAKELESKDKMD